MKKKIKSFLNKVPYVRDLYAKDQMYKANACYPPGHYYSPIVSVKDLKSREDEIWAGIETDGIEAIDLNNEAQRDLVTKGLAPFYKEMPFTAEQNVARRYYFENEMYSYTDGILLYGMMRHIKPKQIIEVGSGFSSALMLDVNQQFFNNKIKLSFIEPNPERLYGAISNQDKENTTIMVSVVQKVPLSFFSILKSGDILFIDSTHVSKCGSDLNYILFDILPSLAKGVMIHFHDIFYPFEYPKGWIYEGRNWNENYILRAFLMNNDSYKIKLFSHYLHLHHTDVFKDMELSYKNYGGNLWLEKQV